MIMDFKIKFEEKVNEYENTVEKLEQQISGLREENRRLEK
jgi:exonuclease VII small subunit